MKSLEDLTMSLNLKVQKENESLNKQASAAGSLEEIWAKPVTPEVPPMNFDFEKQAGISEDAVNQLCIAAAIDHIEINGGLEKQAEARYVGAQEYVVAYCNQFNKEATMQKVASFNAESQALSEIHKMASLGAELVWNGFMKAAEADSNGTQGFVAAPGQIANDATNKLHAPQTTVADGEFKTLKAPVSANISALIQKSLAGSGQNQGGIFQLSDPVENFIGKK